MPPMESHESQELKKGLEELMRENRKLREEVERLEKAQSAQFEEDPTFSTPTGEGIKEAETTKDTKEADRPPKEPVSSSPLR